jgi:hypothetical protein
MPDSITCMFDASFPRSLFVAAKVTDGGSNIREGSSYDEWTRTGKSRCVPAVDPILKRPLGVTDDDTSLIRTSRSVFPH